MAEDPRELQFEAVVRELNSERAATMGRAGRKVDTARADYERARHVLATCRPEARADAMTLYRNASDRYSRARDELCLQREALGLLDHRWVDSIYPPPAPL